MLSFALGTLLKATLVLSLGAIAERLWHKRGAELRHAVLAICVIGVLLVPLLSALLPSWRAPIPWFPTSVSVGAPSLQAPGPASAALETRTGRTLIDRDGVTEGGPRVTVINAALAARLWPGERALGKRVSVHAPPDRPE